MRNIEIAATTVLVLGSTFAVKTAPQPKSTVVLAESVTEEPNQAKLAIAFKAGEKCLMASVQLLKNDLQFSSLVSANAINIKLQNNESLVKQLPQSDEGKTLVTSIQGCTANETYIATTAGSMLQLYPSDTLTFDHNNSANSPMTTYHNNGKQIVAKEGDKNFSLIPASVSGETVSQANRRLSEAGFKTNKTINGSSPFGGYEVIIPQPPAFIPETVAPGTAVARTTVVGVANKQQI